MSNSTTESSGLLLSGLDGSNPLAFLAAIGALRALSEAWCQDKVMMNWTQYAGAWRPRLYLSQTSITPEQVVSALAHIIPYRTEIPDATMVRHRLRAARGARALQRLEKAWKKQGVSTEQQKQNKQSIQQMIEQSRKRWLDATHPYLTIGKNTNLPASEYRSHLRKASTRTLSDRFVLDQFAALGSDLSAEDGTMRDTAVRTMSGSGHQHQLQFMANLLEQVNPDALERALMAPWDYADPVRNLTLRLDPLDDSRYALQWGNPSTDPTRDESGSMLGANALAVIGLSLISTVPMTHGLATVGFTGTGSRNTYWTWPLWDQPIGVWVVRSLLAHSALHESADHVGALTRVGIPVAYRSQRLTVGKFRNFAPARAVMA